MDFEGQLFSGKEKKKKKNRKLAFWIISKVLLVLYLSLTVANSKTIIHYVL